jgi:hypothetical protein
MLKIVVHAVTTRLPKVKANVGKVNMELQLDATITVLLISKISSTCFGQTFAHLQEHKTETFTTYGTMSCYVVGRVSGHVA